MSECNVCGAEDRLFEAIAAEEIKKVCRICARKNNWPLIKHETEEQMQNERRFVPVNSYPFHKEVDKETKEVDEELRSIVVDTIQAGDFPDLVENFHWHIQHARRLKKVSPKQLAEMIAEPEIIVTMAEKAQLPDDYDKIINKLEQFLSINLKKEPMRVTGISNEEFKIKEANVFDVTTDDLRNLQMVKESQDASLEKENNEDDVELIEEDLEKD